MRSTVSDLIAQQLHEGNAEGPARPANRRLFESMRQLILDGTMPAGARLPPSRDLCQQLGVARNTVSYAYDQLQAEGYTRAVVGSGTFVTDKSPDLQVPTARRPAARRPPGPAMQLSQRGLRITAEAQQLPRIWGAFLPGVPDVSLFPHQKLNRIHARLQREAPPDVLSYAGSGGHAALHEALAAYLGQSRSVVCEPGQIIVTEGVHQALDLVVRLLGDPGDAAWVEDPGYRATRNVLGVNGIITRPLPVDAEGMCLPDQDGQPADPPARFAFVTPSHQYPLGPVMSLRRRMDLLEWASRTGMWIVEDDYDSEFRFSGQPVSSLQGLAPGANVIYVGTFSKTLYPGLRTAYLVVPQALAAAFRSCQAELYRGGHALMQLALAEFIRTGQFASHVRKMRLVYAARRALLVDLIRTTFGDDWLHPLNTQAGLHVVLKLPKGFDDTRICTVAAAQGVLARPLSRYYAARDAAEPGLLLGFGSVAPERMRQPFGILVDAIARAAPPHPAFAHSA